MSINHDCFHDVTMKWAQNLWVLANPHKDAYDFYNEYMPASKPDRGLTSTQRASERAFMTLCYGMAYGSIVSEGGMEALSKSRLVDAWRASVLRNSGQQRFSKFENLLADAIAKHGEQAALQQYPADLKYDGIDMPATLRWMNYKAPRLGLEGIADMFTRGKAAVVHADYTQQGWVQSLRARKP